MSSIPGYLTEVEQALQLNRTTRTLSWWRATGTGPRYVKVGNQILYPVDAGAEFLKSKEVIPVRLKKHRRETVSV